MRFDDVVEKIRCTHCLGRGTLDVGDTSGGPCPACNGSGINPDIVDEASGWGNWAISVHDNPGWIVVVDLGLTNPTVSDRQPTGLGHLAE